MAIRNVVLEGDEILRKKCREIPEVKAWDLDGQEQVYEFEDWDARVMCHEYDHLDGILYTDKATNVREPEEEEEGEEA